MPQLKQALIAGKDQSLAVEFRRFLGAVGFDVTTVEDPAEVAETMGSRRYELVLMSTTLPQTSWRRTWRTLKEMSRTTTVIMLTRSATEADVRLALNAGAYIVLEWPLPPDRLAALLDAQNDGMFVVLRG